MNILILTDFSKNSLNAFYYAMKCFPTAKFTFLHCVNIQQAGATFMIDINSEIKSIKQTEINSLIEGVKLKYPGVDFKGKVEIGLFSQTINEEVEVSKIDIVFIGTKGVSGLAGVLIGSNASDAVRHVLSPMIIVPECTEIKIPESVFLASDFITENYEIERHIIDKFKSYFDVRLDLLHIKNENNKTDKLTYSKIIDSTEINVFIETSENIEDAILNFAHVNNYDMVILVPKDRGIVMNIFHSSITKKMSMHSDLPLFIWKS